MSERPTYDDAIKRITKVTQDHLCTEDTEVTPNCYFIDDLGADSLDVVELIMAMEEEFEMEIRDEDAERLETIAEAAAFVSGTVVPVSDKAVSTTASLAETILTLEGLLTRAKKRWMANDISEATAGIRKIGKMASAYIDGDED